MSAATTGQIEQLVEAYIEKEHPELANHVEVSYERKPSDDRAYKARGKGAQVKLIFKVSPRDPEFKTWLTRAARSVNSIYHGSVVGDSLLAEELAGRRRETA